MPFPCRFFAHREGEGVQRSGAEVVANCGTDPRTRPAGNGEELSRMDESSPRVARFPGPGQARPGRMVFVSPGRPRSCPRGSSCKASFPRFPATEAADKSAPRAATTLEFECERICRQHGVNTGPSHRRKWPYNLSPSGRGAINRAALSANELLLSPYPLPRARELKIDEEDWRCFRLIDREVYLG